MLPEDATGAIQVDFAKVYHGAINPSEITLSETDICLETGMTKEITANHLISTLSDEITELPLTKSLAVISAL